MCARTDIFVKSSIPQAHISAHRAKPKILRSKTFCGYYIIFPNKSQLKTPHPKMKCGENLYKISTMN